MSRRRNLAVGWTLAALAIALFARLGVWQAHSAVEKQAMLDAVAQVLKQRKPQPLAAAADDARRKSDYDWSEGEGAFLEGSLWLLDNQIRDGRAGVRVYGVFSAQEAPKPTLQTNVPPPPPRSTVLLVDLGWVEMPADRRLDEQRISQLLSHSKGSIYEHRKLRGLLAPPPSAGLRLGPAYQQIGNYKLMTRVDLPEMSHAIGAPLAPRVLRLDPALPLGYPRDLQLLANTLPPERHRGYSLQWFALAIAVLVTALILTFRKSRHDR